jgi:hypothetical protein
MGKFFFGFIISCQAAFLFGCEDQGILKADENFSKSNLRTVYVDTFSVVSSTILIDSLPTSGTGTLLVGSYQDPFLGKVSTSTYFQIGYQGVFAPDQNNTFDSIGLILPYSGYYYGDTTQAQVVNVHQLRELPRLRLPSPYTTGENISYFTPASQPAIYNEGEVAFNPNPITSFSIKFSPGRDSLYVPLPQALGQGWFDTAKADALSGISTSYFRNANLFVNDFFNGIHLATNPSISASVVGFNANKVKVRLYYKKLVGDFFQQTFFDFSLVNGSAQFNNIQSDRSNTVLSTLQRRQSIPSSITNNTTFIQSGIGLATKVEFPSLKRFFSDRNLILLDAVLELVPVQNTYSRTIRAPNPVALFMTDRSNVVLEAAPTFNRNPYLTGSIFYDFEYGINTKYSISLINYVTNELKTARAAITPLVIAAPPPLFFSEVSRVVLGSQSNSQNRMKLKIYYSYVQNQ